MIIHFASFLFVFEMILFVYHVIKLENEMWEGITIAIWMSFVGMCIFLTLIAIWHTDFG